MIFGKLWRAFAAQANKLANLFWTADPIAQMQYEYDIPRTASHVTTALFHSEPFLRPKFPCQNGDSPRFEARRLRLTTFEWASPPPAAVAGLTQE